MTIKFRPRPLQLVSALVIIGGICMGVTQLVQAAPTVYTVTNTNDTGAGSLRQALTDANGNGNPSEQDTIRFSIAGSGDKTIQPQTPLIVTQSVLLDGYTQSDSEANTAPAPQPFNGTLRISIDASVSDGLQIQAPNVTIRGLTLGNAETGVLKVSQADGFKLLGSYIDTMANGFIRNKSETSTKAVVVDRSKNVTIGGTAAADRNILGFCISSCIYASGTTPLPSSNLRVQGNYIGVGVDGVGTLPAREGGVGIELAAGAESAIIGGDSAGAGNTIQGNTMGAVLAQDVGQLKIQGNRILFNSVYAGICDCTGLASGVFLGGVEDAVVGGTTSASKNIIAGNEVGPLRIARSTTTNTISTNVVVEGNNFGVMEDGTTDYPNGNTNIAVSGATNYVRVQGNIIRNHGLFPTTDSDGISIVGNSQNVSVLQNSIYDNPQMGIDINNDGPTANDATDNDTGSNQLLNYPTYHQLTQTGGNTEVEYYLNAQNGRYRIDFFSNTTADSPGPGEGQIYLGYQNIQVQPRSNKRFTYTLNGTTIPNLTMTATLIDAESPTGFGPTSEFGGAGSTPPLVSDIASTTTLTNPEAVTLGGQPHFRVTVTNNGPDPIDIGQFDGSSPGANELFLGFLPPQLDFVSGTGTGVDCTWGGLQSAAAFTPLTSSHMTYGSVLCSYTAGTHMLAAGDSIVVDIVTEVIDDSNLQFTTYIFAQNDATDPDTPQITTIMNSGFDIIDYLSILSVNNFSLAASQPADMSLTKTLTNPEAVISGGNLHYKITITNQGPSPLDLSFFNGADYPVYTSLFVDMLPPNLTYVSTSNPDITCPLAVPASSSYYYSAHPDYTIIGCVYSGSQPTLASGQSLQTTLTVSQNADGTGGFTNYAVVGTPESDPDGVALKNAYAQSVVAGSPDFIDLMSSQAGRGFVAAAYTAPAPPDDGTNNQSWLSRLGGTGQKLLPVLVPFVLLLLSVAGIIYVRKSSHEPPQN